MAAPINNNFWKQRSKHGRHAIFTDSNILLAAAYEYFAWNAKNHWHKNEAIKSGEKSGELIKIPTERPLSVLGLSQFLGVTRKYLSNFEKRLQKDDEDFLPIIDHIKEVIERQQLEGAIVGAFNGNICSRLLGLVEKSSHEINFDSMSDEQLDQIISKLKGSAANENE